ncbi:Serine/threonine-protein kinase PrkC [Paraconexibacter sp. AEG42_29]|uniref:non-specific serine/threonine protein kinase n=1 Tax=Paraconexibacter sp. AEG42_29 TaxID=2997339 RepID=A0AAU7ANI7_9ACTN
MTGRPAEGTIIDGRYRVLNRLGSGGMADVYCAEDLQLGRKVALKLLYRRFAEDAEFVERFRREASSAAGLQHPNVVGVYDRGEEDGTQYIAMEYLEGRTLKQVVIDEGPLDPARAVDLIEQVLRAARFAHKRGIIHRDLKPHNVIVDSEDRAKVTDFGIALAGASEMTQTGSIMGTAQYLSPEQAQGQPVDARSDLYSVGIVLYELLTGKVPFEGDSAVSIALKQVSAQPVPPSRLNGAVTPALEQVVMRALAKDPADRPADAEAFINALEATRSGLGAADPTDVTAYIPGGAVPGPATGGGWGETSSGGTSSYELAAMYGLPSEQTYPPTPQPGPVRDDEKSSRWLPALIAGLVVVALVVGGLLLLGGGKEVTVPSVVGAEQAQAEVALKDKGFAVDIVTAQNDKARGIVIGQSPEGATKADEGATVRLTVSSGPGTGQVPDVTDFGRRKAFKALQAAGYKVVEREQNDDEIAKDHVISTNPPARTSLERGQEVTSIVSLGPAEVGVPQVVGLTREAAESALDDAGLKATVTEQESEDKEPGIVLSQGTPATTEVEKGSSVAIVVAKAPEATEVPNVIGKSGTDAGAELAAAGFKVVQNVEPVDSPDDDDKVLKQSPGSPKKLKEGQTVTVTIGSFDPNLDPEPGTTSTGGTTPTPPTTGTTTTTPGTTP